MPWVPPSLRGTRRLVLDAPWVSESRLKEDGCAGENVGVLPIPFVRMPPGHESALHDLAIYEEIDGEPGRYQLE